jgi:hypothetical protein
MFPWEELESFSSEVNSPLVFLREKAFYVAGLKRRSPSLRQAWKEAGRTPVGFRVLDEDLLADLMKQEAEGDGACAATIEVWRLSDVIDAGEPFESPLECALEEALISRPIEGPLLIKLCPSLTEKNLLRARAQGFDGVLAACRGLDVYGLQYLLELARDLNFALVPTFTLIEECEKILETDAPVAVCGDFLSSLSKDTLTLWKKAQKKIPSSLFTALCVPHVASVSERSALLSLPAQGFLSGLLKP